MPRLTRSPLFEIALAVVLAAIVVIASPGVAISAIIALVALVLCGLATLVIRRREGPFSRRRLRRAASGRGRSSRGTSSSARAASSRRGSRRAMPPRPPRDWEQ